MLRVQSAETLVEKQAAALDYMKQAAQIQTEADRKHQDELERQQQSISGPAPSLFHKLLSKPGDFGKQLGGTIHEAVLKAVTEGLSGVAAGGLHPIIYGSNGTGGIAGLFKGVFGAKQDPVKLSTDMNTAATLQNSTVMAGLTAVLAAGMGMAPPAVASPAGIAGIAIPAISAPFVSGSVAAMGGESSSWGGGMAAAGSSAPGLTPEFMRAWTGASGSTARANAGPLSMLRGLRSNFWNPGSIQTGAGTATTAAGIGGFKGDLAGVLTSQGAASLELAGGMPLATAGLTGSRRGTWGGVAESTAGGALVGAGIGTMIMPGIGTLIGAGIGAAAGFGAGVGEKVFGVKSLEQTAHDDIKSLYSVDIPTNSGVIKQIVEMAKSQLGGSINMAVRSPGVRQLVMLYSEATGQKMPLSASTPRAGGLAEQNGILYQAPTFQNGTPYTLLSSLPTLASLPGAGTYPAPGGGAPNYVSLHIDGANTAFFMTGQYVTPQFVQDQAMAAQYGSYNRVQSSANLQQPGLVIS